MKSDDKLIPLFDEAMEQIRHVFKDTALATSKVDATEKALRICIVIRTTLGVEEGNRLMDRFNEWWLDNCHRADGKLSIVMDHVTDLAFFPSVVCRPSKDE